MAVKSKERITIAKCYDATTTTTTKSETETENDSAILGGQQRTKSEKYPNSLQNDLTAERYQNFNFSHRHPLAAAGCASVGRAHRKRYNAAFLHVRTDRPSGQWSLPMRCDATNRFDSIRFDDSIPTLSPYLLN